MLVSKSANESEERIAPSGEPLQLGLLSSLTLFIVLLNALGGLVLILYFLQKSRKSCSTLLNLLLQLSDLISTTTGIFACFEIYRYQRHNHPFPDLALNVSNNFSPAEDSLSEKWQDSIKVGNSIVLGISSRFSTAVFCTLCVVRLLAIIVPFFSANRERVVYWLSVSLLAISLSLIIPFSLRHYSCSLLIFHCMPAIHETFLDIPSTTWNLTVFQILPFLIPCLLVFAVAVASVTYFFRQTVRSEINSKLVRSYHTVLFYCVSFLLTTIPCVAASFLYYIQSDRTIGFQTSYPLNKVKLYHIFLTVFLHLRSLLTILVFFIRSSGFLHFLRRLRQGNVRLLSFINPELDRAIQINLRDKEVQDKIRSHVNSNPAVRDTACSIRWDRKVRIYKIGVLSNSNSNEVRCSKTSVVSLKKPQLDTVSEELD